MNAGKEKVARSFSKAKSTYDTQAVAQKSIAFRLNELVRDVASPVTKPVSMLEIGCGTGLLTRLLTSSLRFETVYVNDIAEAFIPLFSDFNTLYDYKFLPGDAETVNFERTYDLIVSSSVFQWFHSLPVFFDKVRRHLAEEGIFAFSTFGPENLREVKELTGNGLSYLSKDVLTELLSVHFDILHVEENLICLQMPSPYMVLRHLKQTGVNGIEGQTVWTPSRMKLFEAAYREKFSTGKQVRLTYHPVYFVAKLK